jgi:hypothetical protein
MNGIKQVVNPDKTHLMVMATKVVTSKRRQVSLTSGSYTIQPTKTDRLFGGIID